MKTFNLTELIAESVDGVEFSEDRQFMSITLEYGGYSVDVLRDGEWWQDEDFLTEGFILAEEETDTFDYECELPYRTHDYNCYDWLKFQLPANRKAGDRYTIQQLNDMLVDENFAPECAGGFTYHNMSEEE